MLQDWEAGDALDLGAGHMTLQSETVWALAQLLGDPEDSVLDANDVLSGLSLLLF